MKVKLIVLILLSSLSSIKAQEKADMPQKWVYTGFGMVSYRGDLSSYEQFNSSFHLGIQFNKKYRLNGSFVIGFGAVTGQNPDFSFTDVPEGFNPNRYFKSNYFHVNYALHYNLIKNNFLQVYVSQGIGFFRFTPTDQFGEGLQDQPDTRAENEAYRNAGIMLPTKLGAIYFLPNDFGIGVQTGFYGTLTDYLDNISELGESGNDNIFEIRMSLYIPIYTTAGSVPE